MKTFPIKNSGRRGASSVRGCMPIFLLAVGIQAVAAPPAKTQDTERPVTAAPAAEGERGLAAAPWPKFGGGARNAGRGIDLLPPTGQPWTTALFTEGTVGPPALGADGAVFISGRALCALDGVTGRRKWEQSLVSTNTNGAVIDGRGTVYIAGQTGAAGAYKYGLYALDARTGKARWGFALKHSATNTPALGANGLIYAQCSDGILYAVDAATGKQKWQFKLAEPEFSDPNVFQSFAPVVISSPAIGPDGTVYTSHGRLYAVDGETGKLKWVFGFKDVRTGISPAVGPDGTIYIGAKSADGGLILAIDAATGRQKWTFRTGGDAFYSQCALDTEGMLYVGSADKQLYALNAATGQPRWHFATGGWITAAPAIGADHAVYCGSGDGRVYALDSSTGQARWAANLNSPVAHALTLGSCGLLYAVTNNGVVHALRASDGAQP